VRIKLKLVVYNLNNIGNIGSMVSVIVRNDMLAKILVVILINVIEIIVHVKLMK